MSSLEKIVFVFFLDGEERSQLAVELSPLPRKAAGAVVWV